MVDGILPPVAQCGRWSLYFLVLFLRWLLRHPIAGRQEPYVLGKGGGGGERKMSL